MRHGHADLGGFTPQSVFYEQGRFGRLFPTLPPFAADTPLIRDALIELGAKGGPMDAGDDLSDPITLITDPAKSVHNPDNPACEELCDCRRAASVDDWVSAPRVWRVGYCARPAALSASCLARLGSRR
jgi:hypothetical protein